MSKAVGIDLGSTFSVISYVKTDGSVEVIPNIEGNRITPSVFAIDEDNQIMVGELAADFEQYNPYNTVRLVKRKMSEGSEKSYVFNESKRLSPIEVSSEILRKLKKDAEDYLGENVTDAVVTVPAYFNNTERQATKSAAELAGLNVLRIINEPTAASLAYGLDKNNDSTILVYDLGGGTFDVTLLKLSDGCDFHVISTSGDTHLGGADFDTALGEIIKSKTNKHIDEADLRNNAEKAKKNLSQLQTTIVRIQGQQITITRDEFENSIQNLIAKTKTCIDQALRDGGLKYSDIDEVVFVGGSTRIPYVAQKVEEWTGKKPNKSINPDEAVSIGAAIQASVLSGNSDKEVYLVDVCPLSLGVETHGGVMSNLINRNTQVPALHTEVFTTAFDNQDKVEVKVFQGERPLTKDNICLGSFILDNIKQAPRGIPKIEVSFQIDANGVLSVSAKDSENNIERKLEINQSSVSSEQIKKILKEAEENKISDNNLRLILNLNAQIVDLEIQVSELLKTKLFNDSEIEEMIDMQKSLKEAENSQNLELLQSLVSVGSNLVTGLSQKVYDKAKENLVI